MLSLGKVIDPEPVAELYPLAAGSAARDLSAGSGAAFFRASYFPRFAAIIAFRSPDGFALSASVLRRDAHVPKSNHLACAPAEASAPGAFSSPY